MTLEERYEALDKLVRRLEEGFIVESATNDLRAKRHQEWLEHHQRVMEIHNQAMKRHELWHEEHESAMRELDKKLDRIADLMGFRGGNGNV
jgi:hypothetical protein